MQFASTSLPGLLLAKPRLFSDDRGWFAETFNEAVFSASGLPVRFVQDNQSCSRRGVLRGLHYQLGRPQAKLVRVLSGTIYDVAVDLRPESPTFRQWAGFHLSADPLEMLYIPENFAHGFLVLSDTAHVLYKTTDFYHPQGERTLLWNDSSLAIPWPLEGTPIVSPKDQAGRALADAELPRA